MLTAKNKTFIFETLGRMYPENRTELNYTTPFQLLMAVIMSAQTTDKQVNKVTATLFEQIRGPADVVEMGLEQFMEAINAVNFYRNKATNIYKTSQILVSLKNDQNIQKVQRVGKQNIQKYDNTSTKQKKLTPEDVYREYGYWLSDDEGELIKLPGVGVKTAKVVLHCLYDQDVIAVDTHVHRVANRLGFVHTMTPLQTAALIEQVVPRKFLGIAHHTMILFGRYHCKALKPLCESCPLIGICEYRKKQGTKKSEEKGKKKVERRGIGRR